MLTGWPWRWRLAVLQGLLWPYLSVPAVPHQPLALPSPGLVLGILSWAVQAGCSICAALLQESALRGCSSVLHWGTPQSPPSTQPHEIISLKQRIKVWAIPLKQGGSGKPDYAEFSICTGSKHSAACQRGLEQTLLDFLAVGSWVSLLSLGMLQMQRWHLGTWFSSGLGSSALMVGLEEPFPTKTAPEHQELSLCPFGAWTGRGGRSVQCKGRPVRWNSFNSEWRVCPCHPWAQPLALVSPGAGHTVCVRASCKQQGASLQDLTWPMDGHLQSIPWILQLDFAYKQH